VKDCVEIWSDFMFLFVPGINRVGRFWLIEDMTA